MGFGFLNKISKVKRNWIKAKIALKKELIENDHKEVKNQNWVTSKH